MAKRELKQSLSGPTQQPKISFDAWWAVVQKKMPHHHHKEIVMADFKARGLSTQESADAFNNALAKYGVKLK